MTHDLIAAVGLYLGTFLVCLIGGLVPIVNTEVFLVGLIALGAVKSPSSLPAIVLLASLGQMVAKVILYYAGLGMFELPRGRHKEKIDAARARLERWRQKPNLVLAVSSTVGLPPLYLVSLAAGALKMRLRTFLAIGMAGRIVHFAAVVGLAWQAA
jgi:membrane protein YqaA with SNARE-associated domain